MRDVELAEGWLGTGRAAERGDQGFEPLRVEVLPGGFAFPHGDDPKSLFGGSGEMKDQAVGDWVDCGGGNALVVGPG